MHLILLMQAYACEVESQTGNEFVCGNADYDGEIAAGDSFKVDFQGSGNPTGGTFTIDSESEHRLHKHTSSS